MAYRKFKTDNIFTGREILNNDSVLIANQDGSIEALISQSEAGDGIEFLPGMLCPGLINCHCHLELSHLKGAISRGTGLTDFVYAVVTQRHFKVEEIYEAIGFAEEEMLSNGIIAVGDICNNLHTLIQKQKQRLYYYNFIEVSGWLPAIASARFEKSKLFYERFLELSPNLNRVAMAPHAPYSVSDELWQLLIPYYKERTTSIHNQEAIFEDELFETGKGDMLRMYELLNIDNRFFKPSGKSSLQTYLSKLEQAKNILLVHNTFIKMDDLLFAEIFKDKLFFCLCVNANQYIEQALPPIDLLRKSGCRIVLGTDSLASNTHLNILEEIKTIVQFFPDIPLVEALQWATIRGAEALNLDDQLGSFEPGKQPGINLIANLDGPGLTSASTIKRIL
jgi:cytosine/adenosine deaminase-related metal-dependent hydrolase